MCEKENAKPKISKEVEITPEMREVGCRELRSFNWDYEDDEEAVERIYRAMECARRPSNNEDNICSR